MKTNPTISSGIQDITYTYDAVGNITNIADASNTDARHTALYTYDTLYRLTSAMTSVASSSPYLQTYSYDPLGNMTYRSDVGSYMYQGTTTGSYANAHAVTNIAGLTVAYDRNGNQTNFGSTTTAWDYRNRMIYSYASSSPTSIFNTYDHSEQRMTKWVMGVGTTTYPSRFYTTQGATSTISKSIFAGDELIATIKGSGTGSASTTKEYAHLDHLGSTNVLTSATGTVQSAISYFPYGGERVTTASSTTDRHYIGERAESERALSYLNNRYMSPGVGQFLSVDPVFNEVGLTKDGKYIVLNPQAANSYSYSENNPILKKDPTGRVALIDDVAFVISMASLANYVFVDLNNLQKVSGQACYLPEAVESAGSRALLGGILIISGEGALNATQKIFMDGSPFILDALDPYRTVNKKPNQSVIPASLPPVPISSPYRSNGTSGNKPTLMPVLVGQPKGGSNSSDSSRLIFPNMPNFIGTFDFGAVGGSGIYNFGTQSWVSAQPSTQKQSK